MWRLVGSLDVLQRTRFRSVPRTLNFYDDCLVIATSTARRLSPHELRDSDPHNELIALWDIQRVRLTAGELELEIRGSHPLTFRIEEDSGVRALLERVFGDAYLPL